MLKRIISLVLLATVFYAPIGFTEKDTESLIPSFDSAEHTTIDFSYDRVIIKTKEEAQKMNGISAASLYGGLEIEDTKILSIPKNNLEMGVMSELYEEIRLLKLKNKGKEAVKNAVELLDSLPDIAIAEPDCLASPI